MLLNSWSLALNILSIAVLFFALIAGKTAYRVLRYWDPASDDNRQIRLESEIWLTSTLLKYTLGFQVLSLILFVLAADAFCKVIVGAMCATGSLLANPFGMPALLVKIAGLFLYGFWIVLHQLDISVETYPLVRVKYFYFLALIPLLLVDIALQELYLANLSPDIITSCCGVVFEGGGNTSGNLLGSMNQGVTLGLFYGGVVFLTIIGGLLLRKSGSLLRFIYAFGWAGFCIIAMVGVITTFSSYIYAMPYHHCPFCILKPEYYYIGFVLYGALLPASFMGLSVGIGQVLRRKEELRVSIDRMEKIFVWCSLLLLAVFVALSSYHMVLYYFVGGEA